MVTRDEMEAALLDVRKAYRLIHLHQQRCLRLCREIAGAFDSDLNFYLWGEPHTLTSRHATTPIPLVGGRGTSCRCTTLQEFIGPRTWTTNLPR